MKKIYLSAGHSAKPGKDNGAAATYKKATILEGVVAYGFVVKIAEELNRLGANYTVDNDSNVLGETMKSFRKTIGLKDIAVEYHFNAFNTKATGTETVIPDKPSAVEKELAKNLSFVTSMELGITNRGVKTEGETPRKKLGWMRFESEALIHEIAFIDNTKDMDSFFEKQNSLAIAHATILFNYSKL
jgi:N-acetylmuramoyl-L-alanine amidase